ncbi:MAG: MMPL family transporter [Actinomycetota bacterium]
MFTRLARFTIRRRRLILIAGGLFFLVAGAIGGNVASHLSAGGFQDPSAESTRADAALLKTFHTGSPNVVLVVTAKAGDVDASAVKAQGIAVTKKLQDDPDVVQAFSYWTLGSPAPLKSTDGSQALILGRLSRPTKIATLGRKLAVDNSVISVGIGGRAEVFDQVGTQIEHDLGKAELITFPVVLVLLVFVFGSVVAAGLPLAIGGVSVVGTFLILRAIVSLTPVSIYSLNLTTALGLGLGIDYSLFIVSRFREELRAGKDPEDALMSTVNTAGRTVAFSAATVAISLAVLMVFPLYFLRSFAYAGIAVVGLAAISALILLPALLAVIGRRIDKWVVFHHTAAEPGTGMWHRIATFVMRRPVVIALSVAALLFVLGTPFFGVKFGLPDDRVLPASATSRRVQQDIRDNFSDQEAGALSVVALNSGPPAQQTAAIQDYASRLSRVPGVSRVDALSGSYIGGIQVVGPQKSSVRFVSTDSTWWSVVPSVEPLSAAGEQLVHDVRAVKPPSPVMIGGPSAQLVDSKHSIFSKAPLAGGLIALVTFILLFLMTGSVLVPTKAVVLNLLSLTATFGAMVWVFQEGHLSGALNFTPVGFLDTTTPILMFCVAFGLSMDYEVFLLSRIKEEHDQTGDNISSVAMGLERTGRIVTAAALLLAVVFVAIATSGITFIKMFGVGLTLAVVMDATLIRGALVPAFMRLAGRANWWAPAPLRKIYERFGFSESS